MLLDVSIVNVALESISSGLPGASPEAVQWILSGYALAFGLLLVPGGRLGDASGRRMFIVGVALFTLASALCGFAPNGLVLVIARLVQGFAGGLLTPQVTALIQQLFRGKERGTAFGLFGATVGIATAIGPLVGGLLITAFGTENGWRFVFFVNLPVGLVTILLSFRYLPATAKAERGRKHDFDPVGIVLLGAAVVALLLPFVQSEEWKSNAKWWLVVAAVVFAVLFVLWERRYARTKEPVIDLGLFRRRSFSLGVGLATVYFAGFTPLFFVLTLALQSGLHYSALLAGASSVPFAIGSGVASTIGGRVVSRFGRQAHRVRHDPGAARARRRDLGGREPLRAVARLVARGAAARRRRRLRPDDLAEPDPDAVRGPRPAGRLGRWAHPGRCPGRVGHRDRGRGQCVLLGARQLEGRLRAGAAARDSGCRSRSWGRRCWPGSWTSSWGGWGDAGVGVRRGGGGARARLVCCRGDLSR